MKPSAKGAPAPVPGIWVVLHRVGSDNAAPLDSARSGPDGRFRIAYTPFGAEDALYFVSSRYRGIAYFSPPLRADTVRGGDADVIIYETTTDTTKLSLQGRHFVLSMARGDERDVAEVFELENEGTHTIVARDSVTPIWTIHLPADAVKPAVTTGDIGAGAVVFARGIAQLFAPLSPGVRQLVLTYQLPSRAFPLSHPIERPVSVLEVLLEEPSSGVEGARLAEVPPAAIQGRSFRRFLGRDVPASAVMRVTVPPPIARNQGALRLLASVVGLAMALGFATWIFVRYRRPPPASAAPHAQSPVDRLVAELAALDAQHERASTDGAERARYERKRAEIKEQLSRALAEEKQPA